MQRPPRERYLRFLHDIADGWEENPELGFTSITTPYGDH